MHLFRIHEAWRSWALDEANLQVVQPERHPSDKCLYVCAACGEMHESGKCPIWNILQPDPQVVCIYQACGYVFVLNKGDFKLRSSPGRNLALAERSRFWIYPYPERKKKYCKVNYPDVPIYSHANLLLYLFGFKHETSWWIRSIVHKDGARSCAGRVARVLKVLTYQGSDFKKRKL